MPISPVRPTAPLPLEEPDLDRYRDLQQLAYRCLRLTAGRLRPGLSERQAADLLRLTFASAGVHDFALRPQVRFGPARRPALLPGTGPRLRPGTGVLLRCAPRLGRYSAPAVLTLRHGCAPGTDPANAELPCYRGLLLDEVRGGASPARLLAATAAFAARRGHTLASPALLSPVSPLPGPLSPFTANSPLPPGLWALTLQLAAGSASAGFAELLAVTSHSACWLDDDLPHAGGPLQLGTAGH
ncbi:M24 family metallopeptidase [Streptomyces sp. TLI_171]|uniref:M24 family metallopeptidase n=1 Tax=Streptomyces sp. TLI_171 TaxID=1938859 RepID=UPI000C196953|nr:M24 family metallopeptidase [Streptomyces sp. TLI_171]RKE22378.1 metallopeptidase family M24 [Streptomyces sp. TLI_171]